MGMEKERERETFGTNEHTMIRQHTFRRAHTVSNSGWKGGLSG